MKLKIFTLCHKDFVCNRFDSLYMQKLFNYECHNSLDAFKDNFYYETYMINDVYEHQDKYLDNDTKYIGFCHYRRYFESNYNSLLNLLDNNKIILPTKENLGIIYEDFNGVHDSSGNMLKIIDNIVKTNYNNYYDTFKNIMYNSDAISLYNMFICPIDVFNEYCQWIFPIIAEFARQMKFNNYQDVYKYIEDNIDSVFRKDVVYSSRLGGYISERIINVFFHNNYEDRLIYDKVKFIDDIKFIEK